MGTAAKWSGIKSSGENIFSTNYLNRYLSCVSVDACYHVDTAISGQLVGVGSIDHVGLRDQTQVIEIGRK